MLLKDQHKRKEGKGKVPGNTEAIPVDGVIAGFDFVLGSEAL